MSLRIVAISDTHELHNYIDLPDGDMLLHAGDWTKQGIFNKMHDFLKWFTTRPHKYKVFIPGNHELSLDNANKTAARALVNSYVKTDIHFLINQSVEIEGLKIYGSPASAIWNSRWAFQSQRGQGMADEWAQIPTDTNILITHGPPYGILDGTRMDYFDQHRDPHQGCEELTNRIGELDQLKLHVYGHLHHDGGKSATINGTVFANAAICDDEYSPCHKPIVLDL